MIRLAVTASLALAVLAASVASAGSAAETSRWASWPKAKAEPAKAAGDKRTSAKGTDAKGTAKDAKAKAPARATSKAAASKPAAKTTARTSAKTTAKTAAKPPKAPPPVAIKGKGKLAVFAFAGEGTTALRNQVVRALRSNGFRVVTTLRPVDSAEQYREMAVTLGLSAYVDGDLDGDGEQCSATIQIRSGITGLRVAAATFSGERRQLPADVGKTLWSRVGPALVKAHTEAAKPRKRERAPLRINAGTPIEG